MAGFDYVGMGQRAAKVIAKYGVVGSIRRKVGGGSYNPVSGTGDHSTFQLLTTTAVVVDMSAQFASQLKAAGSTVQVRDRQAILDNSVLPLPDDILSVGGEEYTIIHLIQVNPAGIPVIYIAQVRG